MQNNSSLGINSLFFEKGKSKLQLMAFEREIIANGSVKVVTESETVRIFNSEFATILTSKDLLVRNMDTQKEIRVNGLDYLEIYIEGYKEGEQYFETEFKVSPSTLYGANAEQYVRDIHLNFFHTKHTGIHDGWGYVKKQYPLLLTHKAAKEFGYYSGIVNKVEEQVKKYPLLFATFDKCEHSLPTLQTASRTDNLIAELGKYGFFELPKVKQLTVSKQQSLVELINAKGLPYSIAMFEYLGFLKHIEKEHFRTKYKLNKEVAKWFNSDKEGRSVKGNISSLSDYSAENKSKYTAHVHKETVKIDYQKLK